MPKHRLVLFVFLLFSSHSIGQKSACTEGEMRILTSSPPSKLEICFVSETKAITENYFFTKYIIQRGGEEIYEVDFRYFRNSSPDIDSIIIMHFDKQGTTKSKAYSIKFNRTDDCYYIIKDYHVNERDINDTSTVSILFNIPNEAEPYIDLNGFKDISEEAYYFLQNIQPDVRARYNDFMATRDANCYELKKKFNDYQTGVSELQTKMNLYKENRLKEINAEIEKIIDRRATDTAPQELQWEFNNKIDKIFSDHFGKFFSFENNDIDVDFVFKFNGNGKLQDIDKIYKNGSQQNWFSDILNQKVEPIIKMENYKTIQGQFKKPDLYNDFLSDFIDSMYHYEGIRKTLTDSLKCDTSFKVPDKKINAFDKIKKNISDTFETFINKPINLPIAYSYKYRYTTTVSGVTGRWKPEKNEFDIKPSETITPVLYNNKAEINRVFKEKFATRGGGKYDVQICSLEINGVFKTVDIRIIE